MKPDLPYFTRQYLPLMLSLLLIVILGGSVKAQSCTPVSTLTCSQVQVNMPLSLSFNAAVAGTLADANGLGTGFTMADTYSGSRLAQDGTPPVASVPGYEASRLALGSGRLQVKTRAGIAFRTSNNQINTLGVSLNSRGMMQLETAMVNPVNATTGVQGGLWLGLHDKTFLKLVVSASKVELRREIKDVTSTVTGTSNPDQRITATISGLNTATVRLRMVIDPVAQKVTGFYSTNGTTYVNVGAAYPSPALSIAGMGLTSARAYAGIFATHRNNTTPVTYSFDYFGAKSLNVAPAFASSYNFSVSDAAAVGAVVGTAAATDANGDALQFSITGGNTNKAFSIDKSTGVIRVAKILNFHTQSAYTLQVRVVDAYGDAATANVQVSVRLGSSTPAFSSISWSQAARLPYGTTEAHGVVVGGRLYLFGGYDTLKRPSWTPTRRSYVFDPVQNRWDAIAPLPYTPNGTNFGGVTHCGMTTDGTDIYMAGGYRSNSTGTGQVFGTRQAYRYNVATNTYTALPQLPEELAAGQLQYLKGKLHYMGGANRYRADVAIHLVLDLDNLAAGWKPLTPLTQARNHAGSAVYAGKIYYIGGARKQDANAVVQPTVERYDPATNQWTLMANMPTGRDHITSSVVVMGDRILVLGGETAHNVRSRLVSAYAPATNTWSNFTSLPVHRSAGVAAVLGQALYYVSGNFSAANYKGVNSASALREEQFVALDDAVQEEDDHTHASRFALQVYPNPSSGQQVTIRMSHLAPEADVQLLVYDLSGNPVHRQAGIANKEGVLSVVLATARPLLPGTYIVKGITGNGHEQTKLVIR